MEALPKVPNVPITPGVTAPHYANTDVDTSVNDATVEQLADSSLATPKEVSAKDIWRLGSLPRPSNKRIEFRIGITWATSWSRTANRSAVTVHKEPGTYIFPRRCERSSAYP